MFHAAAAPAQINQQYVQQKMGEGGHNSRGGEENMVA